MRLGSLFSGIGGFELAAEWCGHQTIWQSENDPYCTALLAERFPGVPNLGDITKIDWRNVERPDIVAGGFPCQDITYSGLGAGLDGSRSGLWWEHHRALRALVPKYFIVENVAALRTRGLDAVLGSIADLGYNADWATYGAEDVGGRHGRKRLWILGWREWEPVWHGDDYDECESCEEPYCPRCDSHIAEGCSCLGLVAGGDGWEVEEGFGRLVAYPSGERGSAGVAGSLPWQEGIAGVHEHGAVAPRGGTPRGDDWRYQPSGSGWWSAEPGVGRVAQGVPNRVDRMRGLGNAIVPACAVPIFQRIEELERLTHNKEGE